MSSKLVVEESSSCRSRKAIQQPASSRKFETCHNRSFGMSTAPSLALRSLLTGVIRETGLQSPTLRLSGATPPARALAVAAAAKRLSGGTVLLVLPTDAEIEAAV